ncbi:unnamed protein product [Triticum aestivum]|uniref:DUF4220 domain-containing protein n=2 Tax=Triticum aestivum TaxID=4565 RepID=A0A9R1EZZ5_WHEAT|nr:uncharacterized protein LOC123050617 [Triticum aestivum]KAF7019598.1 hypothetical protein CFC21_032758 [Triticum aestivum]SPT20882.1 unnamed protein product [Triticum aestivum]
MVGGLIKVFNEWEIQLLVLLSFTLQLFLLFAGNLRRRRSNGFLRVLIWLAFLGADLVAVYALGLLSRRENNITTIIDKGSQPLAFFWAPFLLIHLGGQDTVTAFSMEDNNLWLRHLLNLVVQVVLAFYVFWRSIRSLDSLGFLTSGVLVFVAGIIKYGERTWCLKRGSLKGLESSTRVLTTWSFLHLDPAIQGYSKAVYDALRSVSYALHIFSARGYCMSNFYPPGDINQTVKIGRLQLGLVYDELYTKAVVLRTKSAMIFRYISQLSIVVAFGLFHAIVDKQRYAKVDIAITYSLFIGGFFIEVWSIILNSTTSPRTWLMLKRRKWERLAKLSWFIFSNDIIGLSEKKQRWPSSIGQYDLVGWMNGTRGTRFSQRVMTVVIRVFVGFFGGEKVNIFWMSKVLDTWYMDADEMTMACVAKEIIVLDYELRGMPTREWPNVGSMLAKRMQGFEQFFARTVVEMHVLTELLLNKYSRLLDSDMVASAEDYGSMVRVCRKLSNYMMYLLVAHPTMLPLTTSTAGLWINFQSPYKVSDLSKEMDKYDLQPTKETIEEMVHMWMRILLYAASKSRAELHVAQLANTGGELITFAWLVMAFFQIGDTQRRRISIMKTPNGETNAESKAYAFDVIASTSEHGSSRPSSSPDERAVVIE